ncbi:AlpA family transcriptional regulator [Bradyrhizobium sp. BRP19]|uniref:helix-turn-helix transcriptional regulator n=1 Tax=Bradyrhizobium sp. BRP19 TaxID=2793823 RepID=UPI001CD740D1|nr:AlpA family transcriptional regulator [Bradyrhizobium sp. BRP19]MCA1546317.1 AlpA family transcriptional regulator [Bradyrhizobium sp. BRP19]
MTEKFMRLPAVLEATGLSYVTIYRMIKKGTFPKQIPLSGNTVGWREKDVAAWQAERMKAAGVPEAA